MDKDKKTNVDEGICPECSSSLCDNCGGCCKCGGCNCSECHPNEADNEPNVDEGPVDYS